MLVKCRQSETTILVNYFYDNGVLGAILASNSSFLVLGRKGAGKTAVFRYLKENPSEYLNDNDILVSLSFEDYNWKVHSLLRNAETADSLAYKQSWRFVILVEVIKAYSTRCKKRWCSCSGSHWSSTEAT